MPRLTKKPRIAVLLDRRASSAAGLFAGVLAHAKGRGWRLTDDPTTADGIITDGHVADSFAVPVIRMSADIAEAAADVRPDAAAVARLAAGHLLDRGFRYFATVGVPPPGREAFDAAIAAHGRSPAIVLENGDRLTTTAALPRPIAIWAARDETAARLAAIVTAAGRDVPGDVAIVGVGDDALICERAAAPISSVDLGLPRLGRTAAGRLGRLLRSRIDTRPSLVPPAGIVSRASTDVLAIEDEDVAAAVRFIRDHTAGPLRVGDVARATGLDRRTLERRLRKALGRSPAHLLRQHRVETAARLLRDTPLPMTEIARACGFRLPQHLAAAFRASFGQTPTAYRAAMRGEADDSDTL